MYRVCMDVCVAWKNKPKIPEADAETGASSLSFLTQFLLAYRENQAELQDSIVCIRFMFSRDHQQGSSANM